MTHLYILKSSILKTQCTETGTHLTETETLYIVPQFIIVNKFNILKNKEIEKDYDLSIYLDKYNDFDLVFTFEQLRRSEIFKEWNEKSLFVVTDSSNFIKSIQRAQICMVMIFCIVLFSIFCLLFFLFLTNL